MKGPKDYGALTTHNMLETFTLCGFVDAKSSVNLITGAGLEPGDILLNRENHTCLYIGNGQVVNARSSEGTCDTADNSGNEIRIQSYWNYDPWNHVLRYFGECKSAIVASAVNWAKDIANNNIHGYSQTTRWGPSYDCSSLVISAYQHAFSTVSPTASAPVTQTDISKKEPNVYAPTLKKGDNNPQVGMAQYRMKKMGYNIGAANPDDEFGSGTESGVNYLRFGYGLPQTGIIDADVWEILLSS